MLSDYRKQQHKVALRTVTGCRREARLAVAYLISIGACARGVALFATEIALRDRAFFGNPTPFTVLRAAINRRILDGTSAQVAHGTSDQARDARWLWMRLTQREIGTGQLPSATMGNDVSHDVGAIMVRLVPRLKRYDRANRRLW